MLKVNRYPDVVAIVARSPEEAEAVAALAHREVADGNAVNILFEHKGARVLVSRLLRSGYGFHVGHASRGATEHTEVSHAVAAALQQFHRSAREIMTPTTERTGRPLEA